MQYVLNLPESGEYTIYVISKGDGTKAYNDSWAREITVNYVV